MKKVNASIPVYDLHAIDPGPVHNEISVGPIANYYNICDKLVIPHRNDFYQIVLVTHGGGTKTIDLEQFDIQPGQIFFMVPGQVHNWKFKGKSDGYVVNFYEKIFRTHVSSHFYLEQFPFLRGIPRNSIINLQNETVKEILHFIKRIIHEVKKKDTFSTDIICFNLISIFVSIVRNSTITDVSKQIPEQNQMTLFKFRMLVNQHYIEKRLPKDYAALLYVTPSQLNAICKDLFGKSAGQIIRERILLEAKRLLINTDVSISEVADKLNFTDNSYFTKFFKKHTGITPQEFRK